MMMTTECSEEWTPDSITKFDWAESELYMTRAVWVGSLMICCYENREITPSILELSYVVHSCKNWIFFTLSSREIL